MPRENEELTEHSKFQLMIPLCIALCMGVVKSSVRAITVIKAYGQLYSGFACWFKVDLFLCLIQVGHA